MTDITVYLYDKKADRCHSFQTYSQASIFAKNVEQDMLRTLSRQLKITSTKLIAVSKTKPDWAILDLYNKGQRVFGENKALELASKYERLPKDIEWHFIGHLQTNKVKYIAPFVHCIHSIDSIKLLKEVNKRAMLHDRVIDCLLQFHIAEEASKYGLDELDAKQLIESHAYQAMENIRLTGVMGMATFTDDMVQVRREFKRLKTIFDSLKSTYFSDQAHFKEISMGMSGDYEIAVEEGSTMVRIGTLLFGRREYQ